MKKIVSLAILATLTMSSLAVSQPASAVPGTCSPEDPCDTWAVIGDGGAVTNVIVCQQSVCGSGEFAGLKVAPQVQGNKETGNPNGGIWGGPGNEQAVTYTEQDKTFHINDNSGDTVLEEKTITFEDKVVEIKIEAPVGPKTRTFTYDSSIETGQPDFKAPNVPVTLTATETVVSVETESGVQTNILNEIITFQERKTEVQVYDEVATSGLTVIFDNIVEFFKFNWLKDWLL